VALALASAASAPAPAAPASIRRPVITDRLVPRAADRLARVEVGADVSPRPANPFDPAGQQVRVVLRDPTGVRRVVDASWFQDFARRLVDGREVLTPVGTPYWKAAFVPTVAGRWWWRWQVGDASGRRRGRWHRLAVSTRPAGHGFLRVSPRDHRYLAYEDGTPYFAIGENLAWYDGRGTFAYDAWLDRLAAEGATWVRLWMPSWAMGIEWADTGLGDYTARLDRAWQLDHVLGAAAVRGIAVQLVVQNHGAFSTGFNSEWADNPYNAANGGPLATPDGIFTDPVANDAFRRRLRYLVARYGGHTNLLAWELWNEADLTDRYDPSSSAAWHRDTAEFVRAVDPFDHLVTTSFGLFFDDPVVWRDSGLDLTQIHLYSQAAPGVTLFPDVARAVVDLPRDRVRDFGRPTLFAELGAAAAGPAETVAADPEGIVVHDGLWAAPFGQALGTGMSWWWDNVIDLDPDRYYPMFGSIASFLAGVAFDREHFAAVEPPVTTAGGRPVRAHALVGDGLALLWVKDAGVRYDAPTRVTVTDARVALDQVEGRWCAAWWDTWAGRWYWLARFTGGAGRTLAMPPFAADTAVRMVRC
jgi:hypothetical protein